MPSPLRVHTWPSSCVGECVWDLVARSAVSSLSHFLSAFSCLALSDQISRQSFSSCPIHSVCTPCSLFKHSRTTAAATRFGLLGLRCEVPSSHVRFLGLAAFERVLGRKQSSYTDVLQVS